MYWDGMLMLTGDINIGMLHPSDHLTKRYQGILDMFELAQIVKRPTRVTRTSKTLIDHFITNHPQKVINTGIIPCTIVSDHDAIYACVNVRFGSSLVINLSGTLGTLKRTCLERTLLLFLCLLYPTRMIQTNNWNTLNTLISECLERHDLLTEGSCHATTRSMDEAPIVRGTSGETRCC